MQTYESNFPTTHVIHKDIRDVTALGDKLEDVDVISAGFPCQPFSVAGNKRGMDDPRGSLFLEITRLLQEFGTRRPKIVILENVRGFLAHNHHRTFTVLRHELQRAGYWFGEGNVKVLNTSAVTRIPQNRERVFMVAFSSDWFDYNDFEFPDDVEERVEVRSLLDLGEKAADRYYFDTEKNKYGQMFEKKIAKGDPSSIYLLRRNYVRENRNGESFTLTANMGEGGHNVPVILDKWGIRKLTPRECSRLQGIDPNRLHFLNELSDSQKYRQIGNAVTVTLVERLAITCKKHISDADQRRSTPKSIHVRGREEP